VNSWGPGRVQGGERRSERLPEYIFWSRSLLWRVHYGTRPQTKFRATGRDKIRSCSHVHRTSSGTFIVPTVTFTHLPAQVIPSSLPFARLNCRGLAGTSTPRHACNTCSPAPQNPHLYPDLLECTSTVVFFRTEPFLAFCAFSWSHTAMAAMCKSIPHSASP